MKQRKGVAAGVVAGIGVLGLVALSLGTPDGCASSEGLIGPEGGVLYSEDGRLTLDIPEGALSTEVEVGVRDVDCEREDEAACYEIAPQGLALTQPATATFEAAEFMSMDSLSLSVEGASGWQKMADQEIDREDEVVTASMLFFSTISIQAR